MENEEKPLCFGCASAKFFIWEAGIGSQFKRIKDNLDFVPMGDDKYCKVKCVFNRMFVPAPEQLIDCPDFETHEEAAKRIKREKARKKAKNNDDEIEFLDLDLS